MQPMIFRNKKDFLNFLNNLPVPENTITINGKQISGQEIINDMKESVDDLFFCRKKMSTLIGNTKSLDKFILAINGGKLKPLYEAFNSKMEEIESEVETLVKGGTSEELASELSRIKSKVEMSNLITQSITAFKNRFLDLILGQEINYASLINTLKQDPKNQDIVRSLSVTHSELLLVRSTIEKYCDQQINFNKLFLS